MILHAGGADKDPELAGMVYASALIEKLFTYRDLPEPSSGGLVDIP
jgi:hypothetical protein